MLVIAVKLMPGTVVTLRFTVGPMEPLVQWGGGGEVGWGWGWLCVERTVKAQLRARRWWPQR